MATNSLSRSLDVVVNITRPSAETATDMTLGCILTGATAPAGWSSGQTLALYTELESFAADWPSSSLIYKAGVAFFAQSPRPTQLAVGLTGTITAPLTIADKANDIQTLAIAGGAKIFAWGLDSTLRTTITAVAAKGTATFSAQPSDANTITINSGAYRFKNTMAQANDVKIGETLADTLANLVAAINGTGTEGTEYYAGTSNLSASLSAALSGSVITFTAATAGVAGNALTMARVGTVITLSGATLEGGADAGTSNLNQKLLADWCLGGGYACFLSTNSADAYNSALATDIGSLLTASSNNATCVFYHDFASEYPEFAAMSTMLSVDYAGVNTVKTLKFKTLSGITASSLTATQNSALDAKNYNVVARTGNVSIFVREGKNTSASWYTDDYIGIQNFREELQVAVFNVFLQKRKVPYTSDGQTMLQQAAEKICQRYVNNGFLADRADVDADGNTVILPAYQIVPGNIALATASDRAARLAPPIAITAYESGAIHKVVVNVDMIQ